MLLEHALAVRRWDVRGRFSMCDLGEVERPKVAAKKM